MPSGFEHQRVEIATGPRSGLTIAVAVHSTALGSALGGCRLWSYDSWDAALDDALRLSAGMTSKNALAGLPHGGGKAVIRLEPGAALDARRRTDAFLDLGDIVESFAGGYVTAEDVGTLATDMAVVATRTPHVVGLPSEHGGLGDPGQFTARGVIRSIEATLRHLGRDSIAGTRFAIAGLGSVGGRVARLLHARGAELVLSDVNPARKELADELGARWAAPEAIHAGEVDVFVPAGVGGMLTGAVIDELRCTAVVGPANNQLAEESGAQRLDARGILYAPDYLVNAGGVIYLGSARPGDAASVDEATARVDAIAETLELIYSTSAQTGVTPLVAADRLVAKRLAA